MYAISLDLGTSGFRAYLIDLETKQIIKTSMTTGHPLPGCNVMDHLTFAIENKIEFSNKIILNAIKKIIMEFNIDINEIVRLSVCGNPIQLSLFQNIEIRDLAYAGENILKRLKIEEVDRSSKIIPANEIFKEILNLKNCIVIIPPAIKHEIGADALAMMTETDFLTQKKPCIVTDYGTNAEMAIKINDKIITASAAAGPAIEGQGIKYGMLACPGSICDIKLEKNYWRLIVLNNEMNQENGDIINPRNGDLIEQGDIKHIGITGTGVISCLSLALKTKIIEKLPHIKTKKIYLGNNIEISENDIIEIGKAIGAIRAAHLTLMEAIKLDYNDLEYTYISGATGTYVNCEHAAFIGLVPSYSKNIVQFGNTSMALAYKLALEPSYLSELNKMAKKIKTDHLMMATSDTFKDIYLCELSFWEQGMDMKTFDEMMTLFNHIPFPHEIKIQNIEQRIKEDINKSSEKIINMIEDIGFNLKSKLKNCIQCYICEKNCPQKALKNISGKFIIINSQKCLGSSCKRCANNCIQRSIDYSNLLINYENHELYKSSFIKE